MVLGEEGGGARTHLMLAADVDIALWRVRRVGVPKLARNQFGVLIEDVIDPVSSRKGKEEERAAKSASELFLARQKPSP